MAYATIRRGASGDGFFAVPAEGSPFFISAVQLSQLKLHDNQDLSEDEFHAVRSRVLGMRCRRKAMDLLASREHSRRELELKLTAREFPSDVVSAQLEQLEAEGLLSDKRFAEQFVVSRQHRNPEGPSLLIFRLVRRGVDPTVAEDAVTQWFSDEDAALDAVRRAAQRIARRKNMDKERIATELRRKGFGPSEIERTLAEQAV